MYKKVCIYEKASTRFKDTLKASLLRSTITLGKQEHKITLSGMAGATEVLLPYEKNSNARAQRKC